MQDEPDAEPAALTVLGPCTESLGVTLPAEHLLYDGTPLLNTKHLPPGVGAVDNSWVHADRISLPMLGGISLRPYSCRQNLLLPSMDDAAEELRELKASWGGGCVVDCTPIGLGRDPEGLAKISGKSLQYSSLFDLN